MAKETGLGAGLFLDGYDISGDSREVGTISKSMKPIPQTGIDKYAMERNWGLLDGAIDAVAFFNPTNAHLALGAADATRRANRIFSYMHKQTVLGTPVASLTAKQTNYDPSRGNDGSLTAKVAASQAQYWLDWGKSLTAGQRTDTGATNGTGVDFGDPSPLAFTFGLQAYLHVIAITGTDATVKLQQSNDNGATDPWADVVGGGFTALSGASAHTAQRISTARNLTVKRYLRAVTVTTGGFSSLKFVVAATVNVTDMTGVA